MDINHAIGTINIPALATAGFTVTGTYTWADLKGHFTVNTSGGSAPVLVDFDTGITKLGYNTGDFMLWNFHLGHELVVGGAKFVHPHVQIARGATAATTDLVLTHVIKHNYGNLGVSRGTSPTPITLVQTITVAQINAIGSGNEAAFDILAFISGGTGGLLNSDNWLPDDTIDLKTTVTSIPTITGGATTRVSISNIDIHQQVRDGSGTKNKDRTGGSFYA